MSENPVSYLLGKAGVRPSAFEEKNSISHTTMTNVVAGTFNNVPPVVERKIAKLFEGQEGYVAVLLYDEYGYLSLNGAYHAWQKQARALSREVFQVPANFNCASSLSPFDQYILQTTVTPTSFAKTLRVPTAAVRRWALGHTAKIPDTILKALIQVGYEDVHRLIEEQEHWLRKDIC